MVSNHKVGISKFLTRCLTNVIHLFVVSNISNSFRVKLGDYRNAILAQRLEQLVANQQVVGSNPICRSIRKKDKLD